LYRSVEQQCCDHQQRYGMLALAHHREAEREDRHRDGTARRRTRQAAVGQSTRDRRRERAGRTGQREQRNTAMVDPKLLHKQQRRCSPEQIEACE
jgi:hypothetical protein